jgi:hypothetical protein
VRELAELGLIESIDREPSRRPAAHSRKIEVWSVKDAERVCIWLATHPAAHESVALV